VGCAIDKKGKGGEAKMIAKLTIPLKFPKNEKREIKKKR